jgi:hypothetical protein
MPRSPAVDANHGVLTDHSIPRTRGKSEPPQGHDLIAFLGNADDRAIGLAYAEMGDKRAREYLLRAAPAMRRCAYVSRLLKKMPRGLRPFTSQR